MNELLDSTEVAIVANLSNSIKYALVGAKTHVATMKLLVIPQLELDGILMWKNF